MENSTPLVKVLDGKSFYFAFLAGAQRIFENQGLINKINVFPVADADTGTNLASTFRSIVESPIPTNNIKLTANALADAALVGARGNSGIIFAQFLHGFSTEIQDDENLTIDTFARSVANAFKYAYESISNPLEGTMISVIRAWSEFINNMKDLIDDFVELLVRAFHVAVESLVNTTKQLEALAKANVVDAGAKGFVLFLEGMVDFIKNRQLSRQISFESNEIAPEEVIPDSHEEITFRYCCEALLSLDKHQGTTKQKIKDLLVPFGDSLVVAGSDRKVRVHIHSDSPVDLFKVIGDSASITYQKVDDMVQQRELTHNAKWPVALMTDSTCDIPDELLEKYQITMVPLTLQAGNSCYLDRTTISSSLFYDMLEDSPVYPSTSQPAYKDFINKYSYLSSHFNSVVGIHVNERFSGTFSNSQRAAKAVSEQTGKKIHVHNSGNVSSGMGLIVLRAAEAIEQGMDADTLAIKLTEWNAKSHLLASLRTTKYLVKSGRLTHSKGMVAKLLNVNPILTIDTEGKPATFGKSFNESRNREKVLAEAKRLLQETPLWGYAISHIQNEKTANWYAENMELITGRKPMFITDCSPVLGVNGGPGTVVLSVMVQ